jgi:hypothetical protein
MLRQERSRPLLDGFHDGLEAQRPKVLPKSPVRGAMDWLDIDNNEDRGARAAAIHFGLSVRFVGSEEAPVLILQLPDDGFHFPEAPG